MPDSPLPTKKALQEELRRVQNALKKVNAVPRYPSVRRKCKYCGTNFNTPATYNGSQMKFCKPAHRKAFDKEGEKPIDVILRKQERRMRQLAREEADIALRVATAQLFTLRSEFDDFRSELRPAGRQA
jgi:hypothetical protein